MSLIASSGKIGGLYTYLIEVKDPLNIEVQVKDLSGNIKTTNKASIQSASKWIEDETIMQRYNYED